MLLLSIALQPISPFKKSFFFFQREMRKAGEWEPDCKGRLGILEYFEA